MRLITAPSDPNLQAQVVFDEIGRIRRLDPEVTLGEIAVLSKTHRALVPLRALCEVEALRYEVLSREGAKSQLSLMRSREGWRTADLLRNRGSKLVSIAALRRWLDSRDRGKRGNPYWDDLSAAVSEMADSTAAARLPAAEVIDALYEASGEARQHGHGAALKLMTAHGAKGLEFRHVIVMDRCEVPVTVRSVRVRVHGVCSAFFRGA